MEQIIEQNTIENLIEQRGEMNRGINYERIAENIRHKYNDTEEAFQEEWNKNYAGKKDFFDAIFNNRWFKKRLNISVRDRFVMATIIQWLGSNVGIGFLQVVLRKTGYDIVKLDKK